MKECDLNVIAESHYLMEGWVADKLERKASHGEMVAVLGAVEDARQSPCTDFWLPSDIVLRPVCRGEERVKASHYYVLSSLLHCLFALAS